MGLNFAKYAVHGYLVHSPKILAGPTDVIFIRHKITKIGYSISSWNQPNSTSRIANHNEILN